MNSKPSDAGRTLAAHRSPSAAFDLTRRQLRWGLLATCVLHLLILSLYVFSVIPQQHHPADRPFWFHQGGDNVGYFDQARALMDGDFQPNKYPLGFPLTLIPFIAVFRPAGQQDLLEIVSAFWSLLMFPLGQVALAWLAERLTGRRWLALLSVLLWTALPLILYLPLRLVASPEVAETGSVHLTWAQMLSDGPATLFTLLALAAYFRWREAGWGDGWMIGVGALVGFLTLIRFTGALAGVAIGLALLAEKRWRAAAILAVSALIVFSPQMVYNAHFFGGPFVTGYDVLDVLPPEGLFSPGYLFAALGKLASRIGVLLPLAALFGIGLASIGLMSLWRQNRAGALVVGVWLAGYAVLYSVYYYSWNGGLTRFLMPVYPAAAILAAAVVGWVAKRQ